MYFLLAFLSLVKKKSFVIPFPFFKFHVKKKGILTLRSSDWIAKFQSSKKYCIWYLYFQLVSVVCKVRQWAMSCSEEYHWHKTFTALRSPGFLMWHYVGQFRSSFVKLQLNLCGFQQAVITSNREYIQHTPFQWDAVCW